MRFVDEKGELGFLQIPQLQAANVEIGADQYVCDLGNFLPSLKNKIKI